MKQIAYAILAVLILFAGLFAAVPGVRAAMIENVLGWLGYDFPSPNSENILAWGTDWGFTPYNPDYMSGNLQLKGTMIGGETTTDELGLCYQPENPNPSSPFIVIKENYWLIRTGS